VVAPGQAVSTHPHPNTRHSDLLTNVWRWKQHLLLRAYSPSTPYRRCFNYTRCPFARATTIVVLYRKSMPVSTPTVTHCSCRFAGISTSEGVLPRITDVSSVHAVQIAFDEWWLVDQSRKDAKCGAGEMDVLAWEGFIWVGHERVQTTSLYLSDAGRGSVTESAFRGERGTSGRGGGFGWIGSERYRGMRWRERRSE
jgi:hypothetical protein